jgi:hypothetical protein
MIREVRRTGRNYVGPSGFDLFIENVYPDLTVGALILIFSAALCGILCG